MVEAERRKLTDAERRLYAMLMGRARKGVYGHLVPGFWCIHLSTRKGDDNSLERLRADFVTLMAWIRSLGYKVQWFGGMGYTPKAGLVHCHAILRVEGGNLAITRRMLGDKWNEIHGAFAVQITRSARTLENVLKYVTQHVLKDMFRAEMEGDGDSGVRGRRGACSKYELRSRDWLPRGWQRFRKVLVNWYSGGHGGFTMRKEDWKNVDKWVRLWCESKDFTIHGLYGYIKVVNGEIVEVQGTGFYRKD